MTVRVVYLDKYGKERTIDQILAVHNGVLSVEDVRVHEVHEGHSFISDYADDTMSDTDTINIAFKTPRAPLHVKMSLEFNCLVGGVLELWEDPTWTTNTGTLLPIRPRNRNFPNLSVLSEDLSNTPLFTVTGNMLLNVTGLNTAGAALVHHLHAWGSKTVGGGTIADQNEITLKYDTKYVILFTASGDANKAQVVVNWYERTNGT